jgi:hypothetical protein
MEHMMNQQLINLMADLQEAEAIVMEGASC